MYFCNRKPESLITISCYPRPPSNYAKKLRLSSIFIKMALILLILLFSQCKLSTDVSTSFELQQLTIFKASFKVLILNKSLLTRSIPCGLRLIVKHFSVISILSLVIVDSFIYYSSNTRRGAGTVQRSQKTIIQKGKVRFHVSSLKLKLEIRWESSVYQGYTCHGVCLSETTL